MEKTHDNINKQVQDESIEILYDGDCPFCSHYMAWINLKKNFGEIIVTDIRDFPDRARGYYAQGFDLDKGMIVLSQGRLYYGVDAVSQLALMTTESDFFNKATSYIFKSKRLSKICYPLLKLGRRVALFVLGRKKIHS